LVVTFIETYVENGATNTTILAYLEALCAATPYGPICDAIVEQGINEIIAWIKNDETPAEVCTQLQLCNTTSKLSVLLSKFKFPTPQYNKPVSVQGAECGSCEEVISVIENWLNIADNQAEVVQTVEVVCTYMPGWETTCDAIVAAGVPDVVNWIDTYENATQVCNQLGLCASKKIIVHQVNDDCGYCTELISFIETWLANSATTTQI